MRKTSLIILSLAFATFVSEGAMASQPAPTAAFERALRNFDALFSRLESKGTIESYRNFNGGNIFHELFHVCRYNGQDYEKITQKATDPYHPSVCINP